MSLASSRVKMMETLRELRLKWMDVRRDWDDAASHAFEREYLEPLEERVRAALLAIDRMENFAAIVERETRDS